VSAIFGIYSLDGCPVTADLQAVQAALGHRRGGGARTWQHDDVGLGHGTFHTTDEPLDDPQPLIRDRGRFVLTADARIDNRCDLIAALGLGAHGDESIGDAELILAAYKRWGEGAPEHLIGDFAFALWDSTRNILFCARDAMGVRPLYYSHRPGRSFAFSSDITALLACGRVPRRLNEARVADHLLRNFDDRSSTFYEGVVRLPAAHALTVGRQSARLRQFWSLDPTRDLRLASDDEYAEAFRETFLEAVRCRTRSPLPVGSMLSGGLDSSSIACAANLVMPEASRPLRTFSAIFPDLPEHELRRTDERSYLGTVLGSGTFDPSFVRATDVSPLFDWPCVSRHLGQACVAPNLYIHWQLYKAAAGKGVRVLLDGIDGDTTVSHGLALLADLTRAGRWIRFLREARALAKTRSSPYRFREIVWRFGIRSLVPERLVRMQHLRRSSHGPQEGRSILRREFRDHLRVDQRATEERHAAEEASDARVRHHRALMSPLIPYALEFADAASSAFALDVRYPFFDRRLIEFCLAIPADQKLQRGWTRAIMRRALGGMLPREIQWRAGKADLSPNFARGLFERDRPLIKDVVFSGVRRLEQYVDVTAVQEAYRRWEAEPLRRQQEAFTLFTVTTLATWLEQSGLPSGRQPTPHAD
jgi:asparagine synthase (glutamine-hydrolysing)